ncbi:hypothetical protein D3C78_1579970 [compost metagenome]
MGAGAVVVVQGEVHRLDTLHVIGVVANGMGLADRVRGVLAQFLLQRGKEGGKNVDHETIGGGENLTNVLIDDGVEDDRAKAVLFGGCVDLLYHGPRFVGVVDVRTNDFAEGYVFELRQQALTQSFGRNARAIGDKESRSFHLRLGP